MSRSPDGAQRNPVPSVFAARFPDYASLHPGYEFGCYADLTSPRKRSNCPARSRDWVESCSALVENFDGEMELLSFCPHALTVSVPARETEAAGTLP
jgi:hypothetical protein